MENKKSKKKKIIIAIIIFLALFLFISLISKNNNQDVLMESGDQSGELTPEEVIARMDRSRARSCRCRDYRP